MKSITLEMSLKPFKQTDDEYIEAVCKKVFEQWRPLIKNAEEISVLMWTSDGSEILEYSGELDEEFEWCRYIGTATLEFLKETDRKDIGLHSRKRLYMDNPPVMTYRILKKIVSTLHIEGKKAFPNAKIRVGDTFDIGPEFSDSKFKYVTHREICPFTWTDEGDCVGGRFIDATSVLKGDTRKYAAYPNGIPDKLNFGTFLGNQTNKLFEDIGFDYLWLSNGLGFSSEPWTITGKIYDGEKFYPERLKKTKKEVFEFWKYFREACPDYPLECRGTNNSVGIDYATDGVPLYDIYNGGFNIVPPPNSPWAPLNGDFGMEIMGHMSRICELPSDEFLFRYYIHDPWWVNSPWRDRYEGQPYDIYMPMAISRIKSDGSVQSAERLNLLSIDTSYGEMPDDCVNEPTAHLLKAIKNSSDAPAPFVWLYPMKEYTCAESADELAEMYFGDNYIRHEINEGFPLNCVVSTTNFKKHDYKLYKNSIIIAPIASAIACREKIDEFIKKGIPVIVYGSGKMLKTANINCTIKADIEHDSLMNTAAEFGYDIKWSTCENEWTLLKTFCRDVYKRAMTVHMCNNAYIFSLCNKNTALDCSMRFPLGAPLLLGYETEIKDGYATYRFPRSANLECRFFVEQKENGIIGVREMTSVNPEVYRRIMVSGLKDATIYYFPEKYCVDTALVGDGAHGGDTTPEYFENIEYCDGYIKCEHLNGNVAFYMPKKPN